MSWFHKKDKDKNNVIKDLNHDDLDVSSNSVLLKNKPQDELSEPHVFQEQLGAEARRKLKAEMNLDFHIPASPEVQAEEITHKQEKELIEKQDAIETIEKEKYDKEIHAYIEQIVEKIEETQDLEVEVSEYPPISVMAEQQKTVEEEEEATQQIPLQPLKGDTQGKEDYKNKKGIALLTKAFQTVDQVYKEESNEVDQMAWLKNEIHTNESIELTKDTFNLDDADENKDKSLLESSQNTDVKAKTYKKDKQLGDVVTNISPRIVKDPVLTEETRSDLAEFGEISMSDQQNIGALEIRNLGKSYKKRPVLKDISMKVARGEAVGLLGPNGAGKTTCFYMVCGLIPTEQGEIILDGQDVTSLPMYRRAKLGIGYLPQEASIFRGLTVEQNIKAVLEATSLSSIEQSQMLEKLLEEFSITHLRRSPSVALSGGERRRLEIARALATQPNFILLDEPLAGIDPIAVRDIRELVGHLKNRGLGVLITDHNVRETLGIVDRAYILHDGKVLREGTPNDIIHDEEVRRVYLGDEFS